MRTPHHRHIRGLVSAGIAVLAALPSARAQTPSITEIGVLPGWSATRIRAVSADGTTVVGVCDVENNTLPGRAFRWTAAAGLQDLGALPGHSHAAAAAVNADGSVIVGHSGPETFRWTADGMQNLGGPDGGSWSYGTAVSADGSVVAAIGGGGSHTMTRWTADSGMHSIGGRYANGISADGSTIVGDRYGGPGLAVRWTQAAGLQDLGTLPGATWSSANAASGDGSVITGSSGPTSRAFRWTESTGMQPLPTLPGATRSEGLAISPDGSAIVGMSGPAGWYSTRAFLWTEALGTVDLNAHLASLGIDLTGWTLTTATGISADLKTIVGNGLFNGDERGWVAVIPTPGPAAVLALTGIAAAGRRRR